MRPRCVMLMGGNAAGKTTALAAAKARHADTFPGWVWIHGDGINGPIGDQYKQVMRFWTDPAVPGIVIEGVRIYSTIFRCARIHTVRFPRELWLGLMLQRYEIGVTHIQARCAKRGKVYRENFWAQKKAVEQLFHVRYLQAVRKLQREAADVPVRDVTEFWIGNDYAELHEVATWLDRAISTP